MCGIAGLFKAKQEINDTDKEAMQRMMNIQKHRGPDDEGIAKPTSKILLGHRRLSIIDLSSIAKNPMSNEDEKIWLIFNGEIYNFQRLRKELIDAHHTFKSKADSEVILHGYEQWGIEKLLNSLRGMFAFALLDLRDNSNPILYLARDRFGIKPLYYICTDEKLSFASEVNAILASGDIKTKLEPAALIGFLMFGSIPAPLTYAKNIYSLLPGEYLCITAHSQKIRIAAQHYWQLPVAGSISAGFSSSADLSDSINRIETLLKESVHIHLVSDVPVGVFLSGGLDSSAITAFAAQSVQESLRTLTITFDEPEYNEASYARQVADKFHTDHHETKISGKMFIEEIPAILRAMDQPSNDGVNTYFISKAAKEAGLTVLLSGLGGDELFLGYPYYSTIFEQKRLFHLLSKSPVFLRKIILSILSACGSISHGSAFRRFSYLQGMSTLNLYQLVRGFFIANEIIALLDISKSEYNSFVDSLMDHLTYAASRKKYYPASIIDGINSLDFHFYLNNQLLRDSDVMSMAHSVELRVPYLDHKLVEYVKSIPVEHKFNPNITKSLLVGAMKNLLPDQILSRKKWGFIFPFSCWLRNNIDAFRTYLFPCSIMDKNAVNKVLKEFSSGFTHWSKPWCLAVLNTRFAKL